MIAGNIATAGDGGSGGGVFVLLGEEAQLSNTTITHILAGGDSSAVGNGGGIYVAAPSNGDVLMLRGVYVVHNTAGLNGAGGIWNEGTIEITGGAVEDNTGFNCEGGFGCPS